MDPTTMAMMEVFSKMGTAGLLALAVWYVGRKLTDQYEARIKHLEDRSDVCEKDRVKLRDDVMGLQTKLMDAIRYLKDE